jgi:hypothetical protein
MFDNGNKKALSAKEYLRKFVYIVRTHTPKLCNKALPNVLRLRTAHVTK